MQPSEKEKQNIVKLIQMGKTLLEKCRFMKKIQLRPETRIRVIRWGKIIISVLGVLAGISSILAAIYSQQSLELQKNQILKESLPFFKYRYSEDNKAFVVEADTDVNIHSIQWFLPNSDKKFYALTKYSNSLTIDEIISKVWLMLTERGKNIPPPDWSPSTSGYIRCNILAEFNEYNSAVETDTGFPLGILIEYTRKGGKKSYFTNIILIKNFGDIIPQIQIPKTGITQNDIYDYMERGAQKFDKILPIYPYAENGIYIDNTGRCDRTIETFKTYFFKETDFKAFKENLKHSR